MAKNNRVRLRTAKTVSLLLSDIQRVEKRAKEIESTSAAILTEAIELYFQAHPEIIKPQE